MSLGFTREYVERASARPLWELGDGVLYTLCRDHPGHDQPEVIIAKVWLIGRAYAAAIERRKVAGNSSDRFYEEDLVQAIRGSDLDKWLAELPREPGDPWDDLVPVVLVHKQLADLFRKLTGLSKRSLASKYLHFHRPDLFFLYDSRASDAVRKLTPRIARIPRVDVANADREYLGYVGRCQWLRDSIRDQFGLVLTPRQLDSLLLNVAAARPI